MKCTNFWVKLKAFKNNNPSKNYSLVKDLQRKNEELKKKLIEKNRTIELQQKVISLLESKLNENNEKNSNSA